MCTCVNGYTLFCLVSHSQHFLPRFLPAGISWPLSGVMMYGGPLRTLQKSSQRTNMRPWFITWPIALVRTEGHSLRILWMQLCCWTPWRGRSLHSTRIQHTTSNFYSWLAHFFCILNCFSHLHSTSSDDDTSLAELSTAGTKERYASRKDFSAFLARFPVLLEGQPPTKRQRVDSGFPEDRVFYDKWRAAQYTQREEYLLCESPMH